MDYKQRIENYRDGKKKSVYSFLQITASVLLLVFLKRTYDLTFLQAFSLLILAPLAVALILIVLTIALIIAFLIGFILYEEGLVGLGRITKEGLVGLSKLAYQKIFKPILYGKRGGAEKEPKI